jgi:hypothetical protein
MLDLKLVEFHKLFIVVWYCFGLLSGKMTLQEPHAQGLDSLSNDLFI